MICKSRRLLPSKADMVEGLPNCREEQKPNREAELDSVEND
jgi:hypothetical protein